MREKQSKDSWFVEPAGLLALLLLAATALYFQVWAVGAFLCFMFLLCFGSRLWSRAVLKRVDFTVNALQTGCHAGDRLKLKLQVRNRSFLPLVWLDVILPTGKKPLLRQESQDSFSWFQLPGLADQVTGIRERFVWMLWQQEITWEEELLTFHRGVVEMNGALLQAGDGFGLSAKDEWKPHEAPFRLKIYPRVVPVSVQPFLKITQEAVAESRGQTEDITVLKSSRSYQPGDPMKRINWRLLAGSGRMEVNVYETVMPGCAAFVLDPASFCYEQEHRDTPGSGYTTIELREKDFEAMLSFVASCMKAVTEQGLRIALLVPAFGSKEAVFCLPEDEKEAVLQRCMEVLAELDYKKEPIRFPYEEFWQVSHKLGSIYLCSRTEAESRYIELAHHLGRSRARFLTLKRGMEESGEFDCLCAEDIALESLRGVPGLTEAEKEESRSGSAPAQAAAAEGKKGGETA